MPMMDDDERKARRARKERRMRRWLSNRNAEAKRVGEATAMVAVDLSFDEQRSAVSTAMKRVCDDWLLKLTDKQRCLLNTMLQRRAISWAELFAWHNAAWSQRPSLAPMPIDEARATKGSHSAQ